MAEVEKVSVQVCVSQKEQGGFLLIANLMSSFAELCCSTPDRFGRELTFG